MKPLSFMDSLMGGTRAAVPGPAPEASRIGGIAPERRIRIRGRCADVPGLGSTNGSFRASAGHG